MANIVMSDQNDSFILPKDRPTDRQCAAIGRVASTWAVVELGMERILTALSLTPSLLGFVLTDKLGPDNRINAIRSLISVHEGKYGCELVDQVTLGRIRFLTTVLAKMKEDRNFIVHSVWTQNGPEHMGRTDITAAARSGRDRSAGPAERISDIEAFANEVQKASDELWRLARQLPTADAPLLDKLRKRELGNLRRPADQATRQYQRRSYAVLRAPPLAPAPKHGNG